MSTEETKKPAKATSPVRSQNLASSDGRAFEDPEDGVGKDEVA